VIKEITALIKNTWTLINSLLQISEKGMVQITWLKTCLTDRHKTTRKAVVGQSFLWRRSTGIGSRNNLEVNVQVFALVYS